ncbi:MAG: dihydropteroate synthase [Sphingobacteriales bacterium 17-39-43]|nr:MAG: dihydropteroate synthase [Sphingobacteriales bacterium 16-39-50]OZA24680.1 MAG: dihydropteroate synthase [Sphingobacteriales bacterium 17-39-43]HQT22679.1 dihydropteroate synthase [Daejeonella sp.]HQT57631.1 dihydropteroate synthase [Daejeonella sp.]
MTGKNTVFQQKSTLNVRGTLLDLSKPKIMGILNLTPDSFYDGGRNNSLDDALKKTEQILSEGADLIDIGAYSSRPGAEHISEETESERLIPVLRAIVSEFPDALLSIDTFRSEIARTAVNEGAGIINDISAGSMDPEMFQTIANLGVPYIMMHMKGTPQTMGSQNDYEDITTEVCQYFAYRIQKLKNLGVNDLIVDPGFGFAKNLEQNYEILANLEHLKSAGHPVLAALSRKSMIYKLLETDAEHALNGTTAANTIALIKGANILRVHDVKEATEVVKIVNQMNIQR